MIEACDVLNIIQMKNTDNPQWINRNMYRLLYNPTLHTLAYERLKSKPGNMTPGTDGKTLDGYSWTTIEESIQLLKTEQYQPTPVRRQYIPKEKGYRPLGIPSPRDKVIQECVRLILEAIYEPNFHDNSHGFRIGRSCHSALHEMQRNWTGTKWMIETDITQCFDRIDHHRLLDILREKIKDDRFINLIRKYLKAGYLEDWKFHKTYSGTPQGSVISPILTNIYLDKLDQWLEKQSEIWTSGKRRTRNYQYIRLMKERKELLVEGEEHPEMREALQPRIRQLNQQILQTPSDDFNDPHYRRFKFIRYADDVRIGIIGSKEVAQKVKEQLADFLTNDLKLELNEDKTKITHLPSERAEFLGYEIQTAKARYRRRNMRVKGSPHNVNQTVRTTSGNIILLMPLAKIHKKLRKYQAKGQPTSMAGFINQPIEHIIGHFNGVLRGWYNYYQLAENVSQLNYARYVLRYSLAKTIAHKKRSTLYQVFRQYGKSLTYTKPNGRDISFYDQPLKRKPHARQTPATIDVKPSWYPRKTRTRLRDHCAICGQTERIEMHHVRHIRKRGESVKGFKLYLVAINRKQIPVCKSCHQDIHRGKYDGDSLQDILKQIETQSSELQGSSTS